MYRQRRQLVDLFVQCTMASKRIVISNIIVVLALVFPRRSGRSSPIKVGAG